MVESIDWNDGAEDTPQRPRSGLWRRFWRSLTGQPTTGPVCRPVTVQGADGEPVHTTVLGDVPLSDDGHAALGEIVRATQRRFADSDSPWSAWLVDRLLDREWLASDLAEASGGVFNTAQVARWLHSQDVPEPFMAMLAAQACDASVIDALRAAEHGVLVDAIIEEHAERLEQLAKCPCGCEGADCVCGLEDCDCADGCPVCDSSAEPQDKREPLRPEYGIRVDHLSGLISESPVAETEHEAQALLDQLLAERRASVVSAELIQRPVGDWCEIGGDRG